MKKKINSNIQDMYELTPMQEGMLYHWLLDNKSSNYFLQNVININDEVNLDKIKQAINLVVFKHDVLRTVLFFKNANKPRQIILKEKNIEISILDASNASDIDKEIKNISAKDIERGFDLSKEMLVRVTIIKCADKKYKMIWSFHHIIIDGWCVPLVLGDFMNFYGELNAGKTEEVLKLEIINEKKNSVTYGDYVRWLGRDNKEKSLEYWKEYLEDYSNVAEISPTKKASCNKEEVKKLNKLINKEISDKIIKISQNEDATINNILEVAWGILLQKYTGENDVVFGKVVSGRDANLNGIEKVVGLFINTIPLRIKSNDNLTFKEILKDNKVSSLDSTKYSTAPLVEIQNQSNVGKDLIKTLFVFENYYVDESAISSGLKNISMVIESSREQTNYPITITVLFGKQLELSIMYDPSLYEEFEIENI
ncbi:MAG: condensation domain-containing protein, partial [Clostridium sp.]